ncbi:MAG: hypothetical protein HYX74_04370 [Acidobacteria bacterium]|nr:hypothetical protein [Acidobacteriota bacterium]
MNPVEEGHRNGRGRLCNAALFLMIVSGLGALGFVLAPAAPAAKERTITVRAHRYGYDPEIIRVNRGDAVRLRFVSEDVTHGFYLEGYDLDVGISPMHVGVELRKPSQPHKLEVVDEVAFTADREGKFRYRCSMTCGFLHPFMLGEFIVSPNRLFPVSLGLTWGVLVGGFLVVVLKETRK